MEAELQLEFLFASYEMLAFKIQSLRGIIENSITTHLSEVDKDIWLAEVEARKEELDVLAALTTKTLGLSNGNGKQLW